MKEVKAGFGQIHRSWLAKRLSNEYTLPNDNVVTESRTESILQAFKDDVPSRFGRVHDEASEDDWPIKWPRPSLMDNASTPVTGTFLDSCCRAKSFCLPKTAHILKTRKSFIGLPNISKQFSFGRQMHQMLWSQAHLHQKIGCLWCFCSSREGRREEARDGGREKV